MRELLDELLLGSQEIISHYFHKKNFSVSQKQDNTPVTIADQEAELCMRKLINKTYPDHGIIGEEYGSERTDAEYTWVLDPIDGTLAFMHGVPLFTTLIALLKNKQPILGAISQPVTDLTCIGDNNQAWLNNNLVRMRDPGDLSQATMFTTDILNLEKFHGPNKLDNLIKQVKLFRTWGDGFGYLVLASGKADIMIDAKMAPWDILPVIPVVRGAGAKITTVYNSDPVTGSSAVCAHPKLHAQVLNMLDIKAKCPDEHKLPADAQER